MQTPSTRRAAGILFLLGALAAALLLAPAPAFAETATYDTLQEFNSCQTTGNREYFTVKTPSSEDNALYVSGHVRSTAKRLCIRLRKHSGGSWVITCLVTPNAKGNFSVRIDTTKGNKIAPASLQSGSTVAGNKVKSTCPGKSAVPSMSAGLYLLTIAEALTTADADLSGKWWNGSLGGSDGYALNECLLAVAKKGANNPTLVKFTKIKHSNQAMNAAFGASDSKSKQKSRYTDTSLSDIAFVLRNPAKGTAGTLTKSQKKYLKNTAKAVVKGASGTYEKLLRIYEYVGSNLYYDQHAFDASRLQFCNPYTNLYNLRNNKSSANSVKGKGKAKVATTCVGYAAAVISLARSLGIPARMVNGRHLSKPAKFFTDYSNPTTAGNNHWWAEAFVDGRWIFIDACSAGNLRWERSSFGSKGKWVNEGLDSYAYFDPSSNLIANSFLYRTIVWKGSKVSGSTNLSDAVYMASASCSGAKLTKAKLPAGSGTATVKAGDGTFWFSYTPSTRKMTIHATGNSGYTFKGVYNSAGTCVLSTNNASVTLSKGTYKVKFKKVG